VKDKKKQLGMRKNKSYLNMKKKSQVLKKSS